MNLKNMKIGTRLGLGYGLVILLLAGVAAMGIKGMSSTNDALQQVLSVNVKKMSYLNQMSESVHIVARVLRTTVLLKDEGAILIEKKKIDAAREKYNAALEKLATMPLDEHGKTFVRELREISKVVRPLNDKVFALHMAHQDAEAVQVLLKEAGPATGKWQEELHDFIKLQEEKNSLAAHAATEAYNSSELWMSGLTVLAILIGVCSAWLIARSITRPINEAVKVAQRVAAGDLTSRIEVDSTNEIGQMLKMLKDMNSNLVGIVGEVRSGTETIATASGQIASGNLDLSSRTEEQASALEETASSMEELASTVKQNADNTIQANKMVAAATQVAGKGGTIVAEVITTMGAINESSKKIVDIISVIDGIAFQTNILALNAAVEAARAGEQGRGFAVVASEVRSLAQRSASAAKDIKSLIGDSVEKVGAGTQLVDQAGAAMEEIMTSVQRVAYIIADIATAGQEQSVGLGQINEAITQMDDATQQNAALVEQAAGAAASMQNQAENLARMVSVFKLTDAPVVDVLTGFDASKKIVRPVKAVPALHAVPSRPVAKKIANGSDVFVQEWEEF